MNMLHETSCQFRILDMILKHFIKICKWVDIKGNLIFAYVNRLNLLHTICTITTNY
jgi:hypothetical protein